MPVDPGDKAIWVNGWIAYVKKEKEKTDIAGKTRGKKTSRGGSVEAATDTRLFYYGSRDRFPYSFSLCLFLGSKKPGMSVKHLRDYLNNCLAADLNFYTSV